MSAVITYQAVNGASFSNPPWWACRRCSITRRTTADR